jgi:tetraacyldisaccharide 4'-kinase
LIVLYALYRGLRDRRYFKGLDERLGFTPVSHDATIPNGTWLHAVSVGEVISAVELVKELRHALPASPIYVSVTTLAGRALADERLAGLADLVFYAPFDYCAVVRRVLRRLRPRVLVVMETEIWPNLFRETKRAGCGLLIVNGRISDRAFPKYLCWRWFFAAVLSHVDRVLAQNKIAAERFRVLGVADERIALSGNLKYDFRPSGVAPPAVVAGLVKAAAPRAVWIAASTMPPAEAGDPDEDDVVIAEFQKLAARLPKTLLMLVPRRPERFDEAARKLQQSGVRHVRRSQLTGGETIELPAVLLVDTMGELSSLFPLADVVFMGGTLPHRGGHNILEPAFFARPVVTGPHMENFPDIAEEFRQAGAVASIEYGHELADAVERLLADGSAIGARAHELAESKRGATARALEAILAAHQHSLPVRLRTLPAQCLLFPLQFLWRAGVVIDRWRKQPPGRLNAPVISVGGIAMGGAGKTPVTAWIAAKLEQRGLRPAILTRGYRRRTHEKHLILEPGADCPAARTGDEPQILLRRGHAVVGIGADRLSTGREIERRFQPDVMLLDDGFQHWRLDRGIDLVLLDAFDPLAGNAVFPLGRLREPPSALSRASAFVVTRAAPPLPWIALEDRLRQWNPAAPVFYCHTEAVEWVDMDSGERFTADGLPYTKAAAFCGLGNPASFWSSLARLGIGTRFRWAFGDHHHYRPHQVRRLAQQARSAGAEVLLTTEKDMLNLPEEAVKLAAPLRIFWLRMEVRADRETDLIALLDSRLRSRP